MYARLSRYRMTVKDRALAGSELADEPPAVPLLAALPGCRGVWVMAREEEQGADEHTNTIFSLWDTRQQAEQVPDLIRDKLPDLYAAAGIAPLGPPEVEILLARGRPV